MKRIKILKDMKEILKDMRTIQIDEIKRGLSNIDKIEKDLDKPVNNFIALFNDLNREKIIESRLNTLIEIHRHLDDDEEFKYHYKLLSFLYDKKNLPYTLIHTVDFDNIIFITDNDVNNFIHNNKEIISLLDIVGNIIPIKDLPYTENWERRPFITNIKNPILVVNGFTYLSYDISSEMKDIFSLTLSFSKQFKNYLYKFLDKSIILNLFNRNELIINDRMVEYLDYIERYNLNRKDELTKCEHILIHQSIKYNKLIDDYNNISDIKIPDRYRISKTNDCLVVENILYENLDFYDEYIDDIL